MCCPLGARAAPPVGEDDGGVLGVDDPVNKDHAVFGDPIIGQETVLLDEMGPGALEAKSVQTPQGMTAAQWAKHRLTHLPYHPGCHYGAACRRPTTHTTGSPMMQTR